MSTESGLARPVPPESQPDQRYYSSGKCSRCSVSGQQTESDERYRSATLFYDPLLYQFPSSLTHGGPWDEVDVGRGRLEGTLVCGGGGGEGRRRGGGGGAEVGFCPSPSLYRSVSVFDCPSVWSGACTSPGMCLYSLHCPLPCMGGKGQERGGGRERETQSERERERQTDGEKGGYSHGNKKFKSIVVIVTLNPPIYVVISRNWMNKIFGIFN